MFCCCLGCSPLRPFLIYSSGEVNLACAEYYIYFYTCAEPPPQPWNCNAPRAVGFCSSSDDVELHVIKLTYKDLAELSRGDKRGHAIDKATFLQNFPVPGLVGGGWHTGVLC